MVTNSEIWKDIHGFEKCYQISSFGRVRSLDRIVEYKDGRMHRRYKGQVIKLSENSSGYLQVALWKNKIRTRLLVGPLVGRSFINAMWTYEWDHIDENRHNNSVNNLRPCTRSQNNAHRVKGEKCVRFMYGKWQARISYQNREQHLGCFKKKIDALDAYDKAAIKYFGVFAETNNVSR